MGNFLLWILLAWVIMLFTVSSIAYKDAQDGLAGKIHIHWGPADGEEQ